MDKKSQERDFWSYKYLIDNNIFVNEQGENIAKEIIPDRWKHAYMTIKILIAKLKFSDYCGVHAEVLWCAVLDYYFSN